MSDLSQYPKNWPEVAKQVKEDAGYRCVRCGHPHESPKERIPCDEKCDLQRHPEISALAELVTDKTISNLQFFRSASLNLWPNQRQRVLTVHHLDGQKWNLRWWNLIPLCQVCHLIIQAKVDIHRPWVMFEHSEWFKLYVAGFYAHKYLKENICREEAEGRMEELLALERFIA
jgi:hypothetical protein